MCTEAVYEGNTQIGTDLGNVLEGQAIELVCSIDAFGKDAWPPIQDWFEGNNVLGPGQTPDGNPNDGFIPVRYNNRVSFDPVYHAN